MSFPQAFTDFINLVDSYKLVVCETNKAEEIEDYTWTQDGTYTNLYWTNYTEGVPNKVTEDDYDYIERFTLSEANSNAESFYYDFVNQRLYLHTNGSDDPGSMTGDEYDYKIVAFSWSYFCNANPEDAPTIYQRIQERLIDGSFEQWDSATALTQWTESVAGSSTINRESTEVDDGGYSVKLTIDGSNNNASISQNIILQPKGRCKIKIKYKMSTSGKTAKITIKDSGSNVYLDSSADWQTGSTDISLVNQTSWTEYELEFYAHKDYTNYVITFANNSSASASIYLDKSSLEMYREDNYYLPFLSSTYLPAIEQSVSDYHVGSIQMNYGQMKFANDGYWYEKVQNLLWHNKEIVVKYGKKGSVYSGLGQIYTGKTKKPDVSDLTATIAVTDKRISVAKNIPATKYWTSNYPNLEAGAEGLPIPIIYGQVSNIAPIEIDTTTYKYKVAVHALEDITDVYKDGVALTITTDYTLDLANGEFTLVADPEEGFITCDVKGAKCDIEDGTYSENVADILFDLLTNYLDIDKNDIDYESFLDLQGSRTQKHMLYIDIPQPGTELVRILQASSLFHLIPTASGELGAFRYKTGTTAETPRLIDEEYKGFFLKYDTSGIYSQVKIRYNRNPADNRFDNVERSDANVTRKHDIDKTFTLTSSLRLEAEAENIGDYYMDLVKDPLRKITASLPIKVFGLRPAEKIILNKTRLDRDGNSYTVLDEEPYRVLSLKKSFKTGWANVIALEDLQSAGETFCEVCYQCQTCNTSQQGITGSCSSCFTCEKCDSGECESCQLCYYCEACDSGECSGCQSCDTCEKCDSGQCDTCMTCYTCEKCDSGQCESCQDCVACEKCVSGECEVCMICVDCELCVTCDLAQCSSCDTCEKCFTCQWGQCTVCMDCDSCELCVTCETCDACLNSQCSGCQVCNICQKCDSGQCTACQVCDTCEKCVVFETHHCWNCYDCQLCDTCQNSQCDSCQDCYNCQLCNTCEKCDSGECTTCQWCNNCQICVACEVCEVCDVCDDCEECVSDQGA